MDGVLIDTEPYHEAYLTKVLDGLGVTINAELFEQLRGTDAQTFWVSVSKKYGLATPTEDFIEKTRLNYLDFLKALKTLRPTNGVLNLLKILKERSISTAVASSASRIRVDTLLAKLEIKKYFDATIAAQDVIRGKPAPDIFLISAEKINIDPQECVVIEDSTNGIEAAKAAGAKCIGFAGFAHSRQDLSGADMVINRFNEITLPLKSGQQLVEIFSSNARKN